MTAAHVICVTVPVKIVSNANQREHWRDRQAAAWVLAGKERPPAAVPVTITITRIGQQRMDDDNLAGGCKNIRDGISDWLALDDGSAWLTWRYDQRCDRKCKAPSAEVVIAWEIAP